MVKVSIKDAIVLAAELLGLEEDVKEYINGTTTSGKAEVENLLRCFNLVESELALDYLPLYQEEKIKTETGAVYFDNLERAPVRIIRVEDEWGNSCPFKLFPDYLKTQPGNIVVRYSYLPNKKGWGDDSDFTLQTSTRLFAFGMAAEYALSCGRFEEAAIWDKKYKDSIAAMYRSNPSKRISARRWV